MFVVFGECNVLTSFLRGLLGRLFSVRVFFCETKGPVLTLSLDTISNEKRKSRTTQQWRLTAFLCEITPLRFS